MKYNFKIEGMHCAACATTIEKAVRKLKGVKKVNVNLMSNRMQVEYQGTADDIIKAVESVGYKAYLSSDVLSTNDLTGEEDIRKLKQRFILSLIFTVPLFIVAMLPMIFHVLGVNVPAFLDINQNGRFLSVLELLLALATMIINYHYYIGGLKAIFKFHPNMDSLISVGTLASLIYGIYVTYEIFHGKIDGELYFESVGVILTLITLGKLLEAKSKGKTSKAIQKLMAMTPKTALVLKGDKYEMVKAEDIKVGDIIMVKPGEKYCVDGTVISGTAEADESLITGEAILVTKKSGDDIIGGAINKVSTITYKATKTKSTSVLAQIVKLVSEAQNSKAPIAKLADTISGYFVPAVMFIALVASIFWYINSGNLEFSLEIFVSVLIIACPCSLGLATPTAIMVATGKGAENGILIKDGETLELAHKTDTIVFDKTGTITYGKPAITDIKLYQDILEDEFLKIVASLENLSEHPLAKAVTDKYKKKDFYQVEDFKALSGFGITGTIGKTFVVIGNQKLMMDYGIQVEEKQLVSQGKTLMYVLFDKKLAGIIAVRDEIKKTAKETISILKSLNIKTVMLTGDHKLSAKAIGEEIGIDEVIAEVIPSEKSLEIEKLKQKGKTVMMVGDGINDAIALAKADVGVAIGKATDIAAESASVILTSEELINVVSVIVLSKKTIDKIWQNLFWAFIYNIIGMFFATGIVYAFGGPLLNPMVAALAMAMSSVCVVSSALLLNKVDIKNAKCLKKVK